MFHLAPKSEILNRLNHLISRWNFESHHTISVPDSLAPEVQAIYGYKKTNVNTHALAPSVIHIHGRAQSHADLNNKCVFTMLRCFVLCCVVLCCVVLCCVVLCCVVLCCVVLCCVVLCCVVLCCVVLCCVVLCCVVLCCVVLCCVVLCCVVLCCVVTPHLIAKQQRFVKIKN